MGLNRSIIMGRIVRDLELRKTQSGTSVTGFCVAVDRGKDKPTDFIDCVAWEGTAEMICKWFRKGSMIALEGRLQTRTWEDNQGGKHKATEIVASSVYFTGERRDDNQSAGYSQGGFGGNGPEFVEYEGLDDDGDLPF